MFIYGVMKRLVAISSFVLSFVGIAAGADYVGSGACRDCHKERYNNWLASPHFKSARNLTEDDKKNVSCQKCHFTGSEKKRWEEVGCEACHGGGEYYIQIPIMKDRELAAAVGLVAKPTIEICKSCHTETSPLLRKLDLEKVISTICPASVNGEDKKTDGK